MEELYDTMENYVRGRLPETERRAFAERLSREPELAAEVEAFRVAREVVETGIADRLRADFTAWDRAADQTPPATAKVVRLSGMRRLLAVAAGVLLLIGLAFWQYRSTQNEFGSEVLAARYHDSDLGMTRSGAGDTDNELSAATTDLRNRDYPAAIRRLEAVTPSSPYYADARFLLADAYFLDDQSDAARATVAPLLAADDPLLREKAEWLDVLIDLKAGGKDDPAFQLKLQSIADDPAHAFQPRAAELARTLDGFWVKWVE